MDSSGVFGGELAPEDILRMEQEAEYRQLEGEALVEAQRDREMFEKGAAGARTVMYDGDPYAAWGDYELDVWEHTDTIDSDLSLWESYIAKGIAALAFDTETERRDRDGSLGGFNHAECQTTTCRCYLRGHADGWDEGNNRGYEEGLEANEDRQPPERD